jgi:succinate dehydrogenase / fumarate reductase cytochrome b subunit
VTDKNDQRPMSPYMIGPYYRPQLTSMLSIASRLAGMFVAVVTAPLMAVWLLALASGPGPYQAMTDFLGSLPGIVLCLASLFCICYHLANGIRHLIWDTGRMLDLKEIYVSGYIMVVCAVLVFAATLWMAVSG